MVSRSVASASTTSGSLGKELRRAVPVFAALGDAVRWKVVLRLSDEGPLSISRLTHRSGVTRQALTKHLHVLEEVGLVHASREGRERVYELAPRRLEEARRQIETLSAQWDSTLGRLKAFVEEDVPAK